MERETRINKFRIYKIHTIFSNCFGAFNVKLWSCKRLNLSLYDIQLFRFFFSLICVESAGGAVLFFTDSSCKMKVLLWFCSSDWIASCWGGRYSITQQRQLAFDCIVMRHFRKLSHSAVSGPSSHSHCSHTPPTSAIGHSVCGFSLHDSKKATATSSKHHPPVAACRNPRGKTLLGLKEWFVWNAEQMNRMRLAVFQAGDDFSYVYIWTYIPNYLRVDWLCYTWSEARYTAINVRPYFFFQHARTSSSLCP